MAMVWGVLARFCAVGTVGFAVDSSFTLLLTQTLAWDPFPARLCAFLIAATATWSLNRRFTFRSSRGASTWAPYVLFTSVGAAVNVGVFLGWVWLAGDGALSVFTGVALGSIAALGFNFVVSKMIFAGPDASA